MHFCIGDQKCDYYWTGFMGRKRYSEDEAGFITRFGVGLLEDGASIPRLCEEMHMPDDCHVSATRIESSSRRGLL